MSQLSDFFPYKEGRINYLVNCSEKHNFVYVETPKVACSTIKKTLQLIELDGDHSKLPSQVHDRQQSPLLSPKSCSVSYEELFQGNSFFRFCFVRNPFSRILSSYLDKIVENQWEKNMRLPLLGYDPSDELSLLDFLKAIREQPDVEKDIHWTPQIYILQPDQVNYSYIGRFENFAEEFREVIQSIQPNQTEQFDSLKVDFHKTGASSKVKDYIGEEEQQLILEIFDQDFQFFGYSNDLDNIE